MRAAPRNAAASVRQRLFNLSQKREEDFQLVLTHYALERFLYRLTRSPYRDAFILKGAMLFYAWGGATYRPTRDLDLLSKRVSDVAALERAFREICGLAVEDDGLTFEPDTVRGARIQQDDVYAAIRITFNVELARARLVLQVDVGFGDAVTPDPEVLDFPTLLEFPGPRLEAYRPETVVAEKFEAMVTLEMANSRMKDFYDVWTLARIRGFEGPTLARAVKATFERRRTPVPAEPPVALTPAFGEDPTKQAQWRAFVRRSRLESQTPGLAEVVAVLRGFLLPPTLAVATSETFEMEWPASGPWRPARKGA